MIIYNNRIPSNDATKKNNTEKMFIQQGLNLSGNFDRLPVISKRFLLITQSLQLHFKKVIYQF